MLGDAVSAKKASGEAKETLEVVDVAQVLVRSIKVRVPDDQAAARAEPPPRRAAAGAEPPPARAAARAEPPPREPRRAPTGSTAAPTGRPGTWTGRQETGPTSGPGAAAWGCPSCGRSRSPTGGRQSSNRGPATAPGPHLLPAAADRP